MTPTVTSALALSFVGLAGCGGPAQAVRREQVQQPVVAPAKVTSTRAAGNGAMGPAPQGTTIRGLRGTLNHDDIHQTMDAQAPALTACIDLSKRKAPYLDGAVKFAFKVDAEGKPFDVRAVESNVGHQVLEQCFAEVLGATEFPPPSGRTATRDFKWDMSVVPAGPAAEPIDPAVVRDLLKEHARDIYRACEVRRRRNRYSVTVYVDRKGTILSHGAVVARGGARARAAMPCLLEQLGAWRLPRQEQRSKVTFTLR